MTDDDWIEHALALIDEKKPEPVHKEPDWYNRTRSQGGEKSYERSWSGSSWGGDRFGGRGNAGGREV